MATLFLNVKPGLGKITAAPLHAVEVGHLKPGFHALRKGLGFQCLRA